MCEYIGILGKRVGILVLQALSLAVATTAPTVNAAPPDRVVRIGIASSGPPERTSIIDAAVTAGLREHGYLEGKNVTLVRRYAFRLTDPMETYVNDLLAENIDVLVTGCGWSTRVAMGVTKTMPIVMVSVSDPVRRGYIRSLARPGANATGLSGMVDELAPKMLDYLKFALPDTRLVGVVRNERNTVHKTSYPAVEAARVG